MPHALSLNGLICIILAVCTCISGGIIWKTATNYMGGTGDVANFTVELYGHELDLDNGTITLTFQLLGDFVRVSDASVQARLNDNYMGSTYVRNPPMKDSYLSLTIEMGEYSKKYLTEDLMHRDIIGRTEIEFDFGITEHFGLEGSWYGYSGIE